MRVLNLMLFVSLFALLSCQQNEEIVQSPEEEFVRSPEIARPQFIYSHEDSVEGGDIALWFDGRLVATQYSKSQLMYSLKYLRQSYADSQSFENVLSNRFLLPWEAGQLAVKFDSSTAIQVRNHKYTGWNLLDVRLRPDTILRAPDALDWAVLGFSKDYNPLSLADIYRTLPGVLYAEQNVLTFLMGTFPMFPGLQSGEMTYVFAQNYNNISPTYLYFRYINGKPTYIGQWMYYSAYPQPWAAEARMNIDSFAVWHGVFAQPH
ncbi:MAG: hypothetical protein WBW71_13120 [Bacteroidota bacterium]